MTHKAFKIRDYLSSDEIKQLTKRSNTKALALLLANWGIIVSAFVLVALWPNPFTVVIALILIANRQLGLGILTHECAHNALFESKTVNRWVGRWLCGAPSLVDLDGYRSYHLEHHKLAGTDQDPDYINYQAYPVSAASLKRKLFRDLVGITGIKNLMGLVLMQMGVYDYDLSYKPKQRHSLGWQQHLKQFLHNALAPISFQLVLFAVLYSTGHPWLFALWWLSLLTFYSVFARLRNAAEHAAVPDLLSADPRQNTRTTLARWWERLTVAPNFVNYHLEHHMLASVPAYNLARMHQLLEQRDALATAEVVYGYPEVIRRMIGLQSIPAKNT